MSDAEDAWEAFSLSADDKGSYKKAQEPENNFDGVEEATKLHFFPSVM